MIVQKFGGTSVGNAAAIRRVGQIVRSAGERRPLVVVSAVAGVTNRLLQLGQAAVQAADWRPLLSELRDLHVGLLRELALRRPDVLELLEELARVAEGIALLRECTARTRDYLASFGERLCARIVAGHLEHEGVPACALDAWDAGFVSDGHYGSARPLPETDLRIRAALSGRSAISVVTGYIARDASGNITTLGRGGSDYSAAIFGAALGAEEIQIWTDVDGVMTADPRVVANARFVSKLSFAEAAELAFFGAKVLHPATMAPALAKNIPIRVLNSFHPEHEGTRIVAELTQAERTLKSITSKEEIVAVNVIAAPMLLQFGFLERIAAIFRRHEVVVDVIATSEVSVALTTDAHARLAALVQELSQFSEVRVVGEQALVSIVGAALQDSPKVMRSIFDCLASLEVRLEMVSYGATRNNLSLVVPKARLREIVRALHQRLFE